MENKMFCFQCEQTGCGGCTGSAGVCGKKADTAKLQDELTGALIGLARSTEGNELLINSNTYNLIIEGLFTTLTNVNFDDISIRNQIEHVHQEKAKLIPNCRGCASPCGKNDDYEMSELWNADENIRSLKSLILFGLRGMAAYAYHAMVLGYTDDEVNHFFIEGLFKIGLDLTMEELIPIVMKVGEINLKCMDLLDRANTETYGNPSPHKVDVHIKKGPFIIVSGHDLKDLEMLLEQSKGKGINVYTHGEMLPCHGYDGLKKYPHLIGNFGGAWQDQQKQFDNIPGCILMTTNCLMRPRDSYKDRIYSTNVVGWEGVKHIGKKENGDKDFSEIIQQAIELGGFKEDVEPHEILVGFGHHATLSYADKIVEAVKSGKVRHFFLIGGCDGARPGRNYYTEFAENVPKDCIIMTLACGKYRFNKLEFGDIDGLPRLLDIGQCNDVYSAICIAVALADAFDTDVNGLPLSLIVSWYEQKAVADLLALLSLGIKNIYLGPTLPAFLSPNVLQYLSETFGLRPISNAEDDLKTCLKQNV